MNAVHGVEMETDVVYFETSLRNLNGIIEKHRLMPSMCNFDYYSLVFPHCYYTCMFRPNRSSSGVQIFVMAESAAHYDTAFISLLKLRRITSDFVG